MTSFGENITSATASRSTIALRDVAGKHGIVVDQKERHYSWWDLLNLYPKPHTV
jgi:hypothetical protein